VVRLCQPCAAQRALLCVGSLFLVLRTPPVLPAAPQVIGLGTVVRVQLPLMLAWAITIQ
jgi:hypothetical protein